MPEFKEPAISSANQMGQGKCNKTEQEPKIVIKKSSEAPPEVKANPFYDAEWWGRANSPDDIYLPDSDEALSFAIAAHEIGHLIARGKRLDTGIDNFEATLAEEQRAWDMGWEYIQKYLGEYYEDSPEVIPTIEQAFQEIRNILMQITKLSESMYSGPGSLEEKRELLLSENGEDIRKLIEDMKKEKINLKPEWDRFTTIVEKAVKDIISDNVTQK